MKIHKRCFIIYIYMMFILLLLLSFFVFVFFSNKNSTTSTSYPVELSARHQNFTPNLDAFVGINIRMTLRHLVPTSLSFTAKRRRGVQQYFAMRLAKSNKGRNLASGLENSYYVFKDYSLFLYLQATNLIVLFVLLIVLLLQL